MKGKYVKGKAIEYNGSQLSPLWSYMNLDVRGDSIVSFRGPCHVADAFIVDMEDKKADTSIYSPDMLHFVVEIFGADMTEIVLAGRVLICIVMELLRENIFDDVYLQREYDNIYAWTPGAQERGKLSVSVATVSPISGMIHLGLNVTTEGTPVLTVGLEELGVEDIDKFAVDVATLFIEEMQSVDMDSSKVRPVY